MCYKPVYIEFLQVPPHALLGSPRHLVLHSESGFFGYFEFTSWFPQKHCILYCLKYRYYNLVLTFYQTLIHCYFLVFYMFNCSKTEKIRLQD